MAMHAQNNKSVNIGVDVGKDKLDFFIHERDIHWQSENDPNGIKQALKRIAHYSVNRIVVEATGRYELEFVDQAFSRDLPIVVAQPLLIRRFAGALNQLAKTDKIDASVIAEYAAKMQPRVSKAQGKNIRGIKDFIARRRQLIELLVKEKNRKQIMGKILEQSHRRIIKSIEKEIEWTERKLEQAIIKETAWNDKRELLLTVPGVGKTMVYTLLADLPELGTMSNKQISSLVGLAPINRDSGKLRGKRAIYGGRKTVRTTMYMAMLSAIQFNPIIKSFYNSLVVKGKHKKVALIACMRKLITILNAMIRDKTEWII